MRQRMLSQNREERQRGGRCRRLELDGWGTMVPMISPRLNGGKGMSVSFSGQGRDE